MSHRLHYIDAGGQAHLVAVTATGEQATAQLAAIGQRLPQAADRVCVVDDVRGGATRVVRAPENLDDTAGLATVYLAGAGDGPDWQAQAAGLFAGQPVVVLNPRRERPAPAGDPAAMHAEAAWEHRHLGRADLVLFWLAGPVPPLALYLLGATAANPVPCVVGVHPACALRAPLLARLGYDRPDLAVHDSLAATVAAASAALAAASAAPRVSQRLGNPEISAWHLQSAIGALRHGPGLAHRLDHVAAEAAAGAFHLDRPVLVATVYLCVDRLRADPADRLAWSCLDDVAAGLAELTGRRPPPPGPPAG